MPALKPAVVAAVRRLGHDVIDVGTETDAPVDFPVMTRRVTDLVGSGAAERGLLVCGTGVGAAIAANKVPAIRAAGIHDSDVNVACLGAWVVGLRIAEDAIAAFLGAEFSTDPDCRRRVAQLAEMERAAARRSTEHSVSAGGAADGTARHG